jgi:hypothetical protein
MENIQNAQTSLQHDAGAQRLRLARVALGASRHCIYRGQLPSETLSSSLPSLVSSIVQSTKRITLAFCTCSHKQYIFGRWRMKYYTVEGRIPKITEMLKKWKNN